jgi:phosphoserine aminotransferase
MSINRAHNFNAGPSALPLEAVEAMREGFMDFGGMSILEISHRSKEFQAVIDEARALLVELMGIPSDYDILFLQGGAAHQFAMVPLNLMDTTADYALTGSWSKKALAEAKVVGTPKTVFSSQEGGFRRVPSADELTPSDGASYLHITSNNTIFGTQYHAFPDTGATPLVADMSSDILSRAVDVSRFGLIYAGAQKNLGPAGVTAVIIRKDLLSRSYRELPVILRYSTHAEGGSLYNTPPVFSIYAMMHCLRWVKAQGGVAEMEKRNAVKAALLYEAIETSGFYTGVAEKDSRSLMNVTYTLPSEELTTAFVADAKKQGIVGIKGHRSVGGIRASLYNAVSLASVTALVTFMKEFERTRA